MRAVDGRVLPSGACSPQTDSVGDEQPAIRRAINFAQEPMQSWLASVDTIRRQLGATNYSKDSECPLVNRSSAHGTWDSKRGRELPSAHPNFARRTRLLLAASACRGFVILAPVFFLVSS